MGKHVMECLGMTKIVMEDGKVVEVGEPAVKYCPLFDKYRGIKEITSDVVRENIEFRMKDFGMCCENRSIRMKNFLSFGISEILSSALHDGLLDAAVIAADGCGTVVLTDPEIVQGLGGRISGLCETSPIASVIEGVGRENVLDPDTTLMDPAAGVRKAISMGYKRIAVTVFGAPTIRDIREEFGNDLLIIAVHTSRTTESEAVMMFDDCDIITSCASKYLREESKKRDVITAGNKVPIYGVSELGKELVLMKLKEVGKEPWNDSIPEEPPIPLL